MSGRRAVTTLALLATLVLILPARAPAQDDPSFDPAPAGEGYPYDDPDDPAPDPDTYEAALRPYGAWQAMPAYGRFWRPNVPVGWQPYLDGRWVWSPYGWTWVSFEPWSWTFHYGRWSYLPVWGWAWFPGSVWAPAWVSWSWYGGYVGWSPLSPWGRPPFRRYVYVRDYDFCAPGLRGRVVNVDRVPRGVLIHQRDHGPDRMLIERVSRHPLSVMRDRPSASLAPWHGRPPGPRRDAPLMLERGGPDRSRPLRLDRPLAAPPSSDELTIRRGRRPDPDPQPHGRSRSALVPAARPRVDRGERPAFRAPERRGGGAPGAPLVLERPRGGVGHAPAPRTGPTGGSMHHAGGGARGGAGGSRGGGGGFRGGGGGGGFGGGAR